MQKIWVSGANGQVGRSVSHIIDKYEYEMLETDVENLDITDIEDVLRFGELNRPDIIINCSGITDINECEKNPRLAYKVNALGARNLSIVAKKLEARFVQLSTDDVFDGLSDTPYNEYDVTNPKTIYGKSKLAGENYVKEFNNRHFIVRSTWVYGDGDNFVADFLRKVDNNEQVSIANDHYGSPTSAEELAKFIMFLINTNEYGTYHATNNGVCSRYEFAKEILNITNKTGLLNPVPTDQSDFSSVRPAYAVLDNFVISIDDMYEFPDWKVSLRKYLTERGLA